MTQKDEELRAKLVESYNRAKRKDTKRARYDKLMEFEKQFLGPIDGPIYQRRAGE